MKAKKSGNGHARAGADGDRQPLVLSILDRVRGKETALSLNLEKVGLDFGEDRKFLMNGELRLTIQTLR